MLESIHSSINGSRPEITRIYYGLLSALLSVLSVIVAKNCVGGVDTFQLSSTQGAWVALLATTINSAVGGEELVPQDPFKHKLFIIRGLMSIPAVSLYAMGAQNLPSTITIALYNCNVFFAMIIRCIITKTLPTLAQVGLVFFYASGMAILTSPELLSGKFNLDPSIEPLYMLCPLFSALGNAIVTNILQLCKGGVTPNQSCFWLGVFNSSLLGLHLATTSTSTFEFRDQFLWLPISGIIVYLMQNTMAQACKFEKRAYVLSPVLSMNIIFMVMIQAIIGNVPSLTQLLGVAILLSAVVLLAVTKDGK